MNSGCVIQIQFPWPDFEFSNSESYVIKGYGLFGGLRELPYTIYYPSNIITITEGCDTIKYPSYPDAYLLI
jgi:hypothetical protein